MFRSAEGGGGLSASAGVGESVGGERNKTQVQREKLGGEKREMKIAGVKGRRGQPANANRLQSKGEDNASRVREKTQKENAFGAAVGAPEKKGTNIEMDEENIHTNKS